MRGAEQRAMQKDDDDDKRVNQERGWQSDDAVLGADALDAHRQVLEMAATIDILSRDFACQQQELLRAYERIRELSGRENTRHGDGSADITALSSRAFEDEGEDSGRDGGHHGRCCAHQDKLAEMRKVRALTTLLFR